jgi:hypothetical protein
MKNFVNAKTELKNRPQDAAYSLTPSQILLGNAMMYARLLTIETLLIELVKKNNIELKDDDGNVIGVDEYVDYSNELWTREYFESLGEKV